MYSSVRSTIVDIIARIQPSTRSYTYKPLYNLRIMQGPVTYQSLQSVLEVLNSEKGDPDVDSLLKIYIDIKSKAKTAAKLHPLFVLEGLDLSGKSTLTRLLAAQLNAETFKTPPNCISKKLRDAFDAKPHLRTAFYSLGNYIAALEMQEILENKPIVLDRFWHSTVANALALAVLNSDEGDCIPSKGSIVYHWPNDLLKPDKVFFLTVSEPERLRRQSRRQCITKEEELLKKNDKFRENVILAYKNMDQPPVTMIDSDPCLDDVLKNLEAEIHKRKLHL